MTLNIIIAVLSFYLGFAIAHGRAQEQLKQAHLINREWTRTMTRYVRERVRELNEQQENTPR